MMSVLIFILLRQKICKFQILCYEYYVINIAKIINFFSDWIFKKLFLFVWFRFYFQRVSRGWSARDTNWNWEELKPVMDVVFIPKLLKLEYFIKGEVPNSYYKFQYFLSSFFLSWTLLFFQPLNLGKQFNLQSEKNPGHVGVK